MVTKVTFRRESRARLIDNYKIGYLRNFGALRATYSSFVSFDALYYGDAGEGWFDGGLNERLGWPDG